MAIISQALTEEQRERIKAKIDRARAMADTRERVIPEFATPPDGIQCPHCGNTGWTYEVTDDGYESVRACPYCYERRQVVRRLKHSGISPRDYARFNLIAFDPGKTPDSAKMLAMAKKYLAEHTFGGPGFGEELRVLSCGLCVRGDNTCPSGQERIDTLRKAGRL